MRIEWRSRAEGDDALLALDEAGQSVVRVWVANPTLITDFLNDMLTIDTQNGRNGLDLGQRDPESWGRLVLARSDSGDLLHVDPELYWDRIMYWFRSRGDDPHYWKKTQ
jgi:hypothetical protein